jgi:hypothetical protein
LESTKERKPRRSRNENGVRTRGKIFEKIKLKTPKKCAGGGGMVILVEKRKV